jgi:hypothetical protein
VREATNVHAEAAAAREASLHAKIEAAQEIKHVKEAMAHQAEKEVASLKKKLEATERKAKDAADDLQAVVEGKFVLTDKTRIHLRSASVRTYTFFTTGFPRFLSIRGARGLQAFDLSLHTNYSNPNYD